MEYKITDVSNDDLEGIVAAQRDAWRETYPSPENGVSKEWVHERSAGFSAAYIAERLDGYNNDINTLYIVAKNSEGDVLGFLHADNNGEYNELSAIYLAPQFVGIGVGGALMQEYLKWIDSTKDCRLECVSYNAHAIGFYEYYGFNKTEKQMPKFSDVMPVVEMIRLSVLTGSK